MTNKPDCDIIIIEREVKKMSLIDTMINRVIKKYGFEAKETIDFCVLCETLPLNFKNISEEFERLMDKYYQSF